MEVLIISKKESYNIIEVILDIRRIGDHLSLFTRKLIALDQRQKNENII